MKQREGRGRVSRKDKEIGGEGRESVEERRMKISETGRHRVEELWRGHR